MAQKIDVRKLREEYGMSQADLAGRLGLSRPTVVKIEKGERRLTKPEEDHIREIFGAVGFVSESPSDVRIGIPRKNLEKFKQVFLYVLEKTAGKPNVGMTVLYKLLYFIDFDYYEKYEEQIMGLSYIKNHHGPSPREFVKVVLEMKESGELEEVKSKYFTFEQKKFLPHRRADLSCVSARELQMINSVLERYADKSAKELSVLSHKDVPWITAQEGEDINYESVFYRTPDFSVREYGSAL